MSDDKKRDRALQRRVRERQAKTGESYQAAWRQLADNEEPRSAPPSSDEPPASDGARPSMWPSAPRLVLPLNLPPHGTLVPPHQPTRVTARPVHGAFAVERIFISNAGTQGGADDWIVNDLEIDGQPQLVRKDLPGSLFANLAAVPRASSTLSFNGLDPVERDHELAIVVTYIGPNPEGATFFGAATGSRPPQRPTIVLITTRKPLPVSTKTTITARIESATFQIDRLLIHDEDSRDGSADWIVEDLRINGRTQFRQYELGYESRGIPGDLFSTEAIDTFVKLEKCSPGSTIEIDATYVGLNEDGCRFTAQIEGTVVRDDYNSAPPDLRVIVETIGQGPGETVIATCNWRPPATNDHTA